MSVSRVKLWFGVGAVIFGAYIFVLLWNGFRSEEMLRLEAESRLVGHCERRAQMIGDFLIDRRNDAVTIAESLEVSNYLVNKALGMSPLYGLNASLASIETMFRRKIGQIAVRGEPIYLRATLLDETGAVLVDTANRTTDPALGLSTLGEQAFVTVDPGRSSLVASAPILHKGRVAGTVVLSANLSVLSRFLSSSAVDSRYVELLADARSRPLDIGPRQSDLSADMVKALAEAPNNAVTAIDDPSATAPYLGVRAPIPETSLQLLTLVEKNVAYGHIPSRFFLYSLSVFPLLVLLAVVAFERQRRRTVALQADFVESDRQRFEFQDQNTLLLKEVGLRKKIESELILKTEMLTQSYADLDELNRRLAINHDFLGAVLNSVKTHIAILDASGTIIEVNRLWRDYAHKMGLPESWTGVGVNYISVCRATEGRDRDLALMVAEGIEAVIDGRRTDFVIDYPCHTLNADAWFQMRVTPLLSGQGRIVISHDDITDLKRAEQFAARKDQMYHRLYESLLDAFYVVDMTGRFILFNKVFQDMLGYSEEKLRKLTYQDITPEKWWAFESKIVEEQVITNDQSEVYDKEYIRKDGTILPIELRAFLLRDRNGQPEAMWAIVRDISKRKQAEAELWVAKMEADRANLAKSKFLASASHDLRQPVQALLLLLATLDHHVEGRTQAARTVEMMKSAVNSLNGLLSGILDISRLDAGVVVPMMDCVDLGAFVGRLVVEYALAAEVKGLRLRLVGPPLLAWTDPTLLERVVRNLIENALRYTHRGGILVGVHRRGERVAIEVVDTGIGIPDDKLSEIFEEFFQVNNPGRDRGLGLGLGLAIVSRLAHLLGAEVRVASRLDRGARFTVVLPVAHGTPLSAAAAVVEPDNPGGRVLLIEDDSLLRKSLALMLEDWGYHPLPAACGEDALVLAESEAWRFDAIIADHRLGAGLTGTETAQELERRSGHAIPTLVLTGDTAMERIADVHRSGFAMMHKPIGSDELRRKLAELLCSR